MLRGVDAPSWLFVGEALSDKSCSALLLGQLCFINREVSESEESVFWRAMMGMIKSKRRGQRIDEIQGTRACSGHRECGLRPGEREAGLDAECLLYCAN
jgi:hypothetical protein